MVVVVDFMDVVFCGFLGLMVAGIGGLALAAKFEQAVRRRKR